MFSVNFGLFNDVTELNQNFILTPSAPFFPKKNLSELWLRKCYLIVYAFKSVLTVLAYFAK